MAFIKEESEDIKIEGAFKVKQEDTEEQIGWFPFSRLMNIQKCMVTLFKTSAFQDAHVYLLRV